MKKAAYWLVAILIYLGSTAIVWQFHHNAYSKGGRWDTENASGISIFMTFTPIVNTVGCLVIGLESIPDINYNSLFNVKK